MKSLTMRMTMAAAVLAAAVGTASAQTTKADIPFAFKAGDAVMMGGTYLIYQESGGRMFRLFNQSERKSALLMPQTSSYAPVKWESDGTPRLVFECGAGPCTLLDVWTGGDRTYHFRRPKAGRDVTAHLVIVPLRPVDAD